MFGLRRLEFLIILFLAASLIAGIGVSAYKKTHKGVRVEVTGFRMEELNIEGSDEVTDLKEIININDAGMEELMRLKGIGKVLAERIIEHRSQKGRFNGITDIKNVKGVGEKLFQDIKDYISVE